LKDWNIARRLLLQSDMAARVQAGIVFVWLLLLSATLAAPYLMGSAKVGDDLTRFTIRLALVYYGLATGLSLWLWPWEWSPLSARGSLARWSWTLGWATYLVHLVMAFEHYHHWSHADAMRHTEHVSGFGPGIFFSHLFTLLWTGDVAYWWLWPQRYAVRAPWNGRLLHGYMAFVIFNATVVYETGPTRWAGIALFTALALVWAYTRKSRKVSG
jgi:hypothetical protein